MLSRLEKSVLKNFRKSPELLLFSVILLKIIFFYKKDDKNEENKNDLNFRIVNERGEKIKRLMNVNCYYSFS